jgi:hypothetical protein
MANYLREQRLGSLAELTGSLQTGR